MAEAYRIGYMDGKSPVQQIMMQEWDKVTPLRIAHYPWDENGYKPDVTAKVLYTDKGLFLRFEAFEDRIQAVFTQPNDPVCKDSCVEFFINPHPGQVDQYVNFEINPVGTLHLGVGENRYHRRLLEGERCHGVRIQSSLQQENWQDFKGPAWQVTCFIPFTLFETLFGKISFTAGHVMKGNFYKCGDDTASPHYGCWSPVSCQRPDFHRPEYFGDLILT